MNKTEMTEQLAKRAGLSRAKAGEVVTALFNPSGGIIAAELQGGGTLGLHEFGQFSVREYQPRKGRDPRTGKEIDIPARKACSFRPRKGLRKDMKDIVGG
ncbi:MAG: HU family DNA-binding protein [Gemmatimonadetes bacterium]|nr:HU family DNA-binding protein [Gemmatimonadota bacterium]